MANYKSLRRFYLIIEKLRDGRSASFKTIARHLDDNDVAISPRTLQRDIAQIRADFGVDIIYDKPANSYCIDTSTSTNLPSFYRFLELTLTTELLREHLKDKRELLNYLQFEPIESLHGHENLKLILDAILMKRWITFSYARFDQYAARTHEAIPCLLKRYQNRWYLIGKLKSGKVVTFGIDRMSGVKKLSAAFKSSDVEIPEGLEHVVGLNYSGSPERIAIETDSLQAKYLQALPLHQSQKIVKELKDKTVFEYWLIPNYELVQAILRLGGQVKVLEPAAVREEVIQALQDALAQY